MNGYYIRESLAAVGLLCFLGVAVASCLHWYVT